jgi:hypothetical protein
VKQNSAEIKPDRRQYNLSEAKKTRAFWMYSLMLAFNGYFITGLTFHIISIFANAGFDKGVAISIFLPISVVSVTVSIIGNTVSDWIKLKYLLYFQILGGVIATFGLIILKEEYGRYLLIVGSGIMSGLFAVLIAVAWPRFYGRKYLGEISGKAMSMIVFASAVGPSLFSGSFTWLNTYTGVGILSLAFLLIIAIGSIKAKNPQ